MALFQTLRAGIKTSKGDTGVYYGGAQNYGCHPDPAVDTVLLDAHRAVGRLPGK